ncbi:metallopeptidase TldD-related protein [Candidatus Pelagibacter sp.]|nr:metallopeptidase TldD-related protein [Candidatus Pelagibacter sp.]|tara:strand:- start:502 stop:1914 length:1413 start_codon:yes stop_codon:yes gene_type:complete
MSKILKNSELDISTASRIVSDTLQKCDDGELFLENSKSESIILDDNKIKSSSYKSDLGYGLRAITGDVVAYSHSSDLSKKSLNESSKNLKSTLSSSSGTYNFEINKTNKKYYSEQDPIDAKNFKTKIEILNQVNEYIRKKNSSVRQVTATLLGEHRAIEILRNGGELFSDDRPLVRFNVSVMLEKNGRKESAVYGIGGRQNYDSYLNEKNWQSVCDEALRIADVNLNSKPAPAGEMQVVLGPGWPAILIHEAIGHGLEGDFNRKKTSAFHNLVGQKVASKGVTIIDDGTLENKRGSLTIDDEGTPTEKTVLIENGILKNFMQDRMNARLMNTRSTGNGRRESYKHIVMPRMRNTIMLDGSYSQEEMIKSVKKGIFAVSFGGGQVDITSGKFVFNCTEAYEIINGKVGSPIKGATLIGDGPSALKEVSMVGNDMMLDPGIGTCGKAGQGVPVGVGQPSLLINKMTVGGTQL